jgi:hypothetical protein
MGGLRETGPAFLFGKLLKKSGIALFWQRMAPPHKGRSITCDFCGAGPCPAKDFLRYELPVRMLTHGGSEQ